MIVIEEYIDSNQVLLLIKERFENSLDEIHKIYHITDSKRANDIISSREIMFKMISCYKTEEQFIPNYHYPFFISCFSETELTEFKKRDTKLIFEFDNIFNFFDKTKPVRMIDGNKNEYELSFIGHNLMTNNIYSNHLFFSFRIQKINYSNNEIETGIIIQDNGKEYDCVIGNEICNYVDKRFADQDELRFIGELKSTHKVKVIFPIKIFVKLNEDVRINKESLGK